MIPDFITKIGSSVRIYDGDPSIILEFNDAYFIPGSLCIYDKEGARVVESCIRRGTDLVELVDAGLENIVPPEDFITIDEPVLYLSFLPDHWGHFLTEATSRLWARLSHPELSRVAGFYSMIDNLDSKYAEFLSILDLNIGVNVYTSNKPVKLSKCFIPKASFSNRGEAYSVHREVFSVVSEHYLRDAPPNKSDQPVFLSRSKLGSPRIIRRERQLEQAIATLGTLIVYPEQLSLAEQIQLFNRHRNFIGCWGSAFHNIIFSRHAHDCVTDIICKHLPNMNFLMFDAINGNNANYVESMIYSHGKDQNWPNFDLEISVEQFMRYLEGVNHFRRALHTT